MNPMASTLLIVFFVTLAMGLVLSVGNPLMERTKITSELRDAEKTISQFDKLIKQVAIEGNGSAREITLAFGEGRIDIRGKEDSITYEIFGTKVFDYLTRRRFGNLYYLSGGDANCNESESVITMENSRVKLMINRVGSECSWTQVNTSSIILNITQKDSNVTVAIANFSVMINDNSATANGIGYVELLTKGENLPYCMVHARVNSTTNYDVYYTLFAGADFLVVEVKNTESNATVTSNLAFHIGSDDVIRFNDTNYSASDKTINLTFKPEKKYVASTNGNVTLALIFAGSYLKNITLYTNYSSSDYLFRVRQRAKDNRIILALSNVTFDEIDSKLDEIEKDRILGSSFSGVRQEVSDEIHTYIALFYSDIDLNNSLRIGRGTSRLIIKNLGKYENRVKIHIERG